MKLVSHSLVGKRDAEWATVKAAFYQVTTCYCQKPSIESKAPGLSRLCSVSTNNITLKDSGFWKNKLARMLNSASSESGPPGRAQNHLFAVCIFHHMDSLASLGKDKAREGGKAQGLTIKGRFTGQHKK